MHILHNVCVQTVSGRSEEQIKQFTINLTQSSIKTRFFPLRMLEI